MSAAVLDGAVIIRPNNATGYTINDVVAANGVVIPQEMTNASLAASGYVTLVGIRINTDQVANQFLIRIHFWKASVTVAADNAAFAYGGVAAADEGNYQGYVDMLAFGTEDATSTLATAQSGERLIKILKTDVNKSFWYAFEAKGGVGAVPAALQKLWTHFEVIQ